MGMPTSKEKREYEDLERRAIKAKKAQERSNRKVSRSRMWPTAYMLPEDPWWKERSHS